MPMIIGTCVQRYESRLVVAAHAWAVETIGDDRGGNLPARGTPEPQNSRHLSPVERRYETLGVEGTKKAYRELNAALEGLACTVVQTLEQIAPYLARMQSLLSQRGADRKMVLKKTGLPTWTKWAEGYAGSLHCTLRTIQRHILLVREDQGRLALGPGTTAEKRTMGSDGSKPVRLDGRQQAALVKALMAADDLVTALKSGGDWHSALAEYEKVAVTPAKLDAYLNALEGEDREHEMPGPACVPRYWLTPQDEYALLNDEFHFDFDPCPCPKPEGYDSLKAEWGQSSYVNPPFHKWDGGGNGPTAWVRKAIEENKKGKRVVLMLPVQSYVNLLLEAGAAVRSAGRVRWLEADTLEPSKSPSPIACFILR
jgi:hypothetical protein